MTTDDEDKVRIIHIADLVPPKAEETRLARIPLALLRRFEEMEANIELLQAQVRRVSTSVADHDQRINDVEIDINELQLRHTRMMAKLDRAHEIATTLRDDLTDPMRLLCQDEPGT